MRIAIDKGLPQNERSSFYSGYSEQNELTEVTEQAKFGPGETFESRMNYGALPIVAGTSERIRVVLRRLSEIRFFFASQDVTAIAAFDANPQLTPTALVEFITQEKYVTQTSARATSARRNAPSNDRVATRYAEAVWGKFLGHLSDAAQRHVATGLGSSIKSDLLDGLRLSMKNLYDAIDAAINQGKSALANPPTPPSNMPDPQIFENRPLRIDGTPLQ